MTMYKSYSTYQPSSVKWLGDIPKDWELRKLKYIAHLFYGDSLPIESRDDGDIPVYGSNGVVGSHSVANTLAPCLIVGRKGSYGKVAFSNQCAFAIDTAYFIDRRTIQTTLNFKWLFYALSSLELDQQSQDTGVPGLSREFAHNKLLPFPSLKEQESISNFLDRETTRIDTLIAKKKELINLLEKKRTVIITNAVTKGLDPEVPMKDSGISWIGKIPEDWSVMRLKFIMSNIVDCLHSTPTYDEDGEYIAIRTADISPGILDIHNAKRVNAKDYLERIARLKPQVGDIIYSREGERYGMATLVPPDVDLCLAQRVMMFRVSSSNDHTFMMWALNADCTYQQIKQDTVGATSPRVNIETIAEAWLSVPPIKEQQKIGAKISKSCLVIDRLIHTIKAHIEIIQKYRQALITAAVTGKIDVREELERGAA